jgi:hypothetical protein
MLIFDTEVKRASMLEVGREYDSLVSGLPRKLDAEVPCIERSKRKFVVLGDEVLVGKRIEPINGITEGASVPDMLPCECGQAG